MTVDTNKFDTATTGQPHLAKQCLDGLDVKKLTPLSPEVRLTQLKRIYECQLVIIIPGYLQTSYHQHRHNWPRGSRQVHCGQGPVRGSHRQVQERVGEEHHNQARLRKRQDLQIR